MLYYHKSSVSIICLGPDCNCGEKESLNFCIDLLCMCLQQILMNVPTIEGVVHVRIGASITMGDFDVNVTMDIH